MPRMPAGTDRKVRAALACLERRGSKRNRDGMARYGIVASKVFGVSVATMRPYAEASAAITIWLSHAGRPAGSKRGC